MRAVVEAVKKVANGRYTVVRGPLDVTAADYGSKKFMASITTGRFDVTRGGESFERSMPVEIELSTEIYDTPPSEENRGFNDDRIDEIVGHAEDIIESIREATVGDDQGNPAVFRIGKATGEEFATMDWTVQGITLSFEIDF